MTDDEHALSTAADDYVIVAKRSQDFVIDWSEDRFVVQQHTKSQTRLMGWALVLGGIVSPPLLLENMSLALAGGIGLVLILLGLLWVLFSRDFQMLTANKEFLTLTWKGRKAQRIPMSKIARLEARSGGVGEVLYLHDVDGRKIKLLTVQLAGQLTDIQDSFQCWRDGKIDLLVDGSVPE